MATDPIVYRYDEQKGRYGGIPTRDLTQSDVDRLPLKLQAALNQDGSPYEKLTKKEQAEATKAAGSEADKAAQAAEDGK